MTVPTATTAAGVLARLAGERVHMPLTLTETAPASARRAVRDALTEWRLEHLTETAVLIVSELVTNAVLHGQGPASLTLYTDPGGDGMLLIEVRDADSTMPETQTASEDAEDGRGLVLVGELAAAWGAEQAAGGKRVWASLPIAPGAEVGW